MPGTRGEDTELRGDVLVVGPLPPPYMGPALGTQMVCSTFVACGARVLLISTQDEREIHHTGALDVRNVWLGALHSLRFFIRASRNPVKLVYMPIATNRWGYARDALLMGIARVLRRPLVVHLRGAELQARLAEATSVERWLIRTTLGWARMGIALTPSLVDEFAGLIPTSRVRVLENGIPDPWPGGIESLLVERASRAGSAPRELRMLFVSNLLVKKGALTIIRALALPDLEHAVLRVVGDASPQDVKAVTQLAVELGVDQRVALLGPRSGEDKLGEFRDADLMVHPTESDGQPVVLIEGLAAGLPLIGSSFGGVPETIGNCGSIVAPGDPEALARAIRPFIADPDLRAAVGARSRERFLGRYSPGPYGERFRRVFAELLAP